MRPCSGVIIGTYAYYAGGQVGAMKNQLTQMKTSSDQSGQQTTQLITAANTQAGAATQNAKSATEFAKSAAV
jgi:hypothetical protein